MESFRGAGEEVPGVAGAGEASLSPWGREPYFTPTPMPSAQGLAAATGGEAGRSAAPVAVAVGARRGGEAGAGAVPVSAQRAGRPARTSKHQCLECGRRFTQASSLLRHRRVHTGERPFTCQECGKGFIQASDLVKHGRVHSGERAFWCPQCGKSFRQQSQAHLEAESQAVPKARSRGPVFWCPQCGADFNSLLGLTGSSMPLSSRPNDRQRRPSKREHRCLECGRRFTQASSLLRHRRVHTGERPFPCQVCGKGFIQGSDLVKHSRVHSGERAFWCPQCGKRFRQPETLAKHRKLLHRGEGVAASPQEQAAGNLSLPLSLLASLNLPQDLLGTAHSSQDVSGLQDWCGRRFTQASSLLRHRRVHTGERPFLCQVCGKGFIQASDLVNHSRVHSVERAFWCSQCGKRFRQPELLAKHNRLNGIPDTTPPQSSMPLASRPSVRQRRPTKREHRCLECGRRFTQASSLLRHRRVHTGERPFSCQVCGKGFIQASDLVKHSRVHSGERAFWCPQCGKTQFAAYRTLRTKHTVTTLSSVFREALGSTVHTPSDCVIDTRNKMVDILL
uniref:Uncharacterized LOC103189828 n=1 Tax=Callorhinchus milii TaxID=7868 RepID=A0A4W3HK14_CALMI